MLKVKDKAPNFKLPDQDGKFHSLGDYKGHFLLLYFYPRDNTPGCTREACNFRDNYSFLKRKVEIVGISADSVKSHKGFSERYKLPFTLLSDKEKKTIQDYGADGVIFTKRTSFLINPEGIIEKTYERVNPTTHVHEILSEISKNSL